MSGASRRALASAVLVGLSFAACRETPARSGGPSTTAPAGDTVEVEDLLVNTQKRATPDLDVGSPSCPARIVISEGATFECTVLVDGQAVPYRVTLVDVDKPSRTGRYDIRPVKAVILTSRVVEAVVRANPGARVDCGPERVKVLDPGQTLRCVVTDDRGPQVVTLRVDDTLGRVSPVAG